MAYVLLAAASARHPPGLTAAQLYSSSLSAWLTVATPNECPTCSPCLQYAADKGLGIAVNARVDDGLSLGGWRNTLVFDPLEHYGNYSYLKAILYPLADAVRLAMDNGTHVDFEMQGEMGATAFFYPRQWITTGNLVRQRILEGRPTSWKDLVKMGLGMNNNKLCGCINIGIVDAREYLGNFSAAFSAVKSGGQATASVGGTF